MISKTIQIKINDSTIGLSLNEFWYFRYYLKNINCFYNKSENESKKIMISFPGTSLCLVADKYQFKNISSQIDSYFEQYADNYNN